MSPFWFKYLPSFIRRRLDGRHNVQNVIDNTGWLFLDKILRMAGGLLLGVLIARYLGPSQYGQLNYAMAFVALFGTFATLGLEGIVTRDLVKHPELTDKILGSTFALKLSGGFFALLVSIAAISIARPLDDLSRLIVSILSLSLVFQAFETIEFFYKSKVQSKYPLIAKDIAFTIFIIVRVWLLVSKASLITFVWASMAEGILGSVFLIIVYRKQNHRILQWRVDSAVIKQLLADSWPLILSGLAIMIYMRIDQIMLGGMIGDKEVGTYSAALRLSETWYFVPMSIVSSLGPTLVNSKKISEELYLSRLQKLYNSLTLLSVSVALMISLFSGPLINLLYGAQFQGAASILAIHIWSGVFYFLGVAGSQWYLIENMQKYAFYRTIYGAVTNVVLNFILIPKYGGVGAAIATLISQCVASYLSNLFTTKTHIVFKMQTRAFFSLLTLQSFFTLFDKRRTNEI